MPICTEWATLIRDVGAPTTIALVAIYLLSRRLDRINDTIATLGRRFARCPYAKSSELPE